MLLHGLSIGLDAHPEHFRFFPEAEIILGRGSLVRGSTPPTARTPVRRRRGSPALFTCTIVAAMGTYEVQIFCGMIAHSVAEVRGRLRQRYGRVLEDEARVRRGFDASEPLACALVSYAMADLLKLAAEHPPSPLANGLDFQVEQRFEG